MTSCIPPASSKKRSATRVSCVGNAPSAARPAARYSTSCRAPASGSAASSASQAIAAAGSARRGSSSSRRADTSARERAAPPRRLGVPERDARRRAVGVLDAHDPGLDAPDPPRRRAEQEDVAREALDREVLVHLPDGHALRLGDHRVLRRVGDRPAPGERRDARAAPALHAPVHAVAVEERGGAARRRRDPVREHPHDRVEVLPRERAVRPGPPDEREEPVLVDRAARRLGHDLLREDVERRVADGDRLEPRAPEPAHERRALDELVAAQGEETPLRRAARGRAPRGRCAAARVAIAPGEPSWTTTSTSPTSMPSSSEAVATTARSAPVLSRSSAASRRSRERLPWCAATAPSPSRSASACAARSASRRVPDEDERRAVLPHDRGDAVVGLGPELLRRDRRELVPGDLDRDVEPAAPPDLDDRAARPSGAVHALGADEEARDLGDGIDGGGEADALRPPARERLEPLEREREVRAALVAGERVDLVHDHGLDAAERRPAALAREQEVERLGGRDEDVGRPVEEAAARGGGRVAGANRHPELWRREPGGERRRADLRERRLEVLRDVVPERTQR